MVTEHGGSLWFYHEDDLVSEETRSNAFSQRRFYQFLFTPMNSDSPLDGTFRQTGMTEDDLIDGRYLYYRNRLSWAEGTDLLSLHFPRSPIVGFADGIETNPADLVPYAQVVAIDLFNDAVVDALLDELEQTDGVLTGLSIEGRSLPLPPQCLTVSDFSEANKR